MILLVHIVFGAAIGSLAENIYLGIILAYLSHYLLDIFPHVEYLKSVEFSLNELKRRNIKRGMIDVIKILLDFSLGFFIVFLFAANKPILYLYGFLGALPDGFTVLTHLFGGKILSLHHHFHAKKIHFLKNKKISNFWRIITQLLALVISLYILIKLI